MSAAEAVRRPAVQTLAAMVGLKALLDLSYALIVTRAGYYALLQPHLNPIKLVESYALLALTASFLPLAKARPATIFLFLTYLASFLPMLTIYPFLDESRLFTYSAAGFWVLVALIARAAPTPRLPAVSPSLARWAAVAIYGTIAGIAAIVLVVYSGTSVFSDVVRLHGDLAGAYANRARFVQAQMPINGYYFHWLALVLNPLALGWLYVKRGPWLLLLIPLGAFQLFDGAIVGARSYFGALPFVLLILLCVRRSNPLLWITGAIAAMVAAVMAMYAVRHDTVPFDFAVSRFLLLPAQLTYFYYDFFSHHGLIPGAYVVKWFLHLPVAWPYPYSAAPDFVIGATYYHRSQLDAVGGILADAYMNFGYAGLVTFALLLGALVKAIDAVSEGLDERLVVAAFVMPAASVAGTFFVRVLFTAGVLWGLLVLYLISQAARPRSSPETEEAPARSHAVAGVT